MPDETSLPFFDRTATAAGGFPSSRRGYDRVAVDEYVRALEQQLSDALTRIDELQSSSGRLLGQLTETKRQLEDAANPSYAGLGDRAAQILRLAQDQAAEALEDARREGDDLRVQAKQAANEIRVNAEREAADVRTVALADAETMRR